MLALQRLLLVPSIPPLEPIYTQQVVYRVKSQQVDDFILIFSPLDIEDVRVVRLRDSLRSASIHFPLILSDSQATHESTGIGYLFLHHLLRKASEFGLQALAIEPKTADLRFGSARRADGELNASRGRGQRKDVRPLPS